MHDIEAVNNRAKEIVRLWNANNPLEGIDKNVDSNTINPYHQNLVIIGMIDDLCIIKWYVIKTHNCAIQTPTTWY